MARVRVSPEARKDLVAIRLYSRTQFGAKVADSYFRGFNEAFALLRQYPLAGASADDIGENLRSLSHRSHRIYYTYENDSVVIIRILHTARDAESALN